MTTQGKDLKDADADPKAAPRSGPAQSPGTRITTQNASAQSTSRLKALTELDEPDFESVRRADAYGRDLGASSPLPPIASSPQPPAAAADSVDPEPQAAKRRQRLSTDDLSNTEALLSLDLQRPSANEQRVARDTQTELTALGSANSAAGAATPEPDTATRPHTHVAPEHWFDAKLDAMGALDLRQAMAWRFEAVFAAYTLLLPTSSTSEARELLVNTLRRYEKRLRTAAGTPDERAVQTTAALHGQLTEQQAAELEPGLSELEVTLLTLDECLPNDQVLKRFSKQHVAPKQLLHYARFIAARGFGVGYQRDRFELLAQDLLTTKLPSGKLLLTSRKRAANVLLRLTRGLGQPAENAAAASAPLTYLRDSLDRLQNLSKPKQFFDSGFYVDVYGYKISSHARITTPEFLYLSLAINVEVHNRLLSWSQEAAPGKKPNVGALAALQTQLDAQHEAAQAVFEGYLRPLAGANATARAKKAKRRTRAWSIPSSTLLRFAAAALFVLGAVAANLYVLGVVHLEAPVEMLSPARVQELSPLLTSGRLSKGGKHFDGLLARPAWNRMRPRQRQEAAEKFARALKSRGIEHAEVLAYKTRAIQVDFGSVVFVDESQPAPTR